MKNNSFINIVDILISVFLSFAVIQLLHSYFFSLNSYIMENFFFPLITLSIVFVLGVKIGIGIYKTQNGEYFGLIGKIVKKASRNKIKKNEEENFILKDIDLLDEFEKDTPLEENPPVEENSQSVYVEVSEYVIKKNDYYG